MSKTLQKEKRVDEILMSLKNCDYLTQKQIQILHNLKSERNANRFLNNMNEYLSSFRNGMQKVYYLNARGRERIGSKKKCHKTNQIEHILLRNDFYIYLGAPEWKVEQTIGVGDVTIQPDATFIKNDVRYFVEIDVFQSMSKNENKLRRYHQVKQMTNTPFQLFIITMNESRQRKFFTWMQGLQGNVLLATDIR